MNCISDYRLERFILDTRWEDLPEEVKERAEVCFIDLAIAVLLGARTPIFEVGLAMVKKNLRDGQVAILGSREKVSELGAAIAMGHASNALDIDDGHNLIRAHPGTSFIGALLAASYSENVSYQEFLTALVVCYEITIRMGMAMMDFYEFPHSSGTFGSVGSATAMARIHGLGPDKLNQLLSISEFNAPLVPAIRSVEYPSMNKDGVAFGTMIGALSYEELLAGFTGNKNLLEAEVYRELSDDLGETYRIMDLYFKLFPCCRWVHPVLEGCLEILKKVDSQDILRVEVASFSRAVMLSKIVPSDIDEAQYNISYPTAALLTRGKFGLEELTVQAFSDDTIMEMMGRLHFSVDEDYDKRFPEERLARIRIYTKDGRCIEAVDCKPGGEAQDGVDRDWINRKFRMLMNTSLRNDTDRVLELFKKDDNIDFRDIYDSINEIYSGGIA